jgi:hypothetical protein
MEMVSVIDVRVSDGTSGRKMFVFVHRVVLTVIYSSYDYDYSSRVELSAS